MSQDGGVRKGGLTPRVGEDGPVLSRDEAILADARTIVAEAQAAGLEVRLLGALAIRLHSADFADLHRRLGRLGTPGRGEFSDLDFAAYGRQRPLLRKVFEDRLGYKVDPHMLFNRGADRLIYYPPGRDYYIDVFFDRLDFSHVVPFGPAPGRGRLGLDSPTIPLADLLLEKLQIHEINEKDIKDLIVLFRAHGLEAAGSEGSGAGAGDGSPPEPDGRRADSVGRETIDLGYVAGLLADDWGFWYDATTNLGKVAAFAKRYAEAGLLAPEDLADVLAKIERTLSLLAGTPKGRRWLKRSRLGTRTPWWQEVEEVRR